MSKRHLHAILAAEKRHDFDNFFLRIVNPIQNSFQDFIPHVLNIN